MRFFKGTSAAELASFKQSSRMFVLICDAQQREMANKK
jgi:hypothetical protein